MRRIVHILLLLCLPLYGFAMQGGAQHAYGVATLAHLLEHEEGVQHHHDDDGSVHYDDSEASRDHAQDHSSCAQPATCSFQPRTVPPEQLVTRVPVHPEQPAPEPYLDGRRKPPRHALGHAAGGLPHT
ncbi:hypothetical protein [Massilia consociata]|uniref:Uncharacterized protein n=1 Tax=Massilia consociata TaxID=760117 RepID=A0ABV6FJB6_9BURK